MADLNELVERAIANLNCSGLTTQAGAVRQLAELNAQLQTELAIAQDTARRALGLAEHHAQRRKCVHCKEIPFEGSIVIDPVTGAIACAPVCTAGRNGSAK
jgi:hypothetical protein